MKSSLIVLFSGIKSLSLATCPKSDTPVCGKSLQPGKSCTLPKDKLECRRDIKGEISVYSYPEGSGNDCCGKDPKNIGDSCTDYKKGGVMTKHQEGIAIVPISSPVGLPDDSNPCLKLTKTSAKPTKRPECGSNLAKNVTICLISKQKVRCSLSKNGSQTFGYGDSGLSECNSPQGKKANKCEDLEKEMIVTKSKTGQQAVPNYAPMAFPKGKNPCDKFVKKSQ